MQPASAHPAPQANRAGAITPRPYAANKPRKRFVRGRERPRGVVWFGARSFWGHLRHLLASAIATEDVDSRDWMTADPPERLVQRVAELLEARGVGPTVTQSLGRDVWIDYVADTGDDVAVSRAVAGLLFAQYNLPDPDNENALLHAPRGDILLFGGDTAYPVATADEITDRVIAPFNQILKDRNDGKQRVLLGIPGNHDWYDGLDGFGRMFRRHLDGEDRRSRPVSKVRTTTMFGRYTNFAKQFVQGGQVHKPRTLELLGYTPVQGASYFALPLAPGMTMLAVDRQLKALDARQQRYFLTYLSQNLALAPWVVLPDPVHAFGKPSATGVGMIQSLGLTLTARSHFVLSGDIHHYAREHQGPTLHVTAGGGGAFLHPAPIKPRGKLKAVVEWPDARQSRSMLGQVPWKVAIGRSGFLPHFAFLALFAPAMIIGASIFQRTGVILTGPLFVTLVLTLAYSLIGGVRRGHKVTSVFAFIAALLTALLPIAALIALRLILKNLDIDVERWVLRMVLLGVSVFIGVFIFGAYLALLTRLGYENTQAFTALDHPGFKHFVRFRVRADGLGVDGWCVGLEDPLGKDAEPVLVDRFSWRCR